MKSIIILMTFLVTAQSFAISKIHDVKKATGKFEVVWGTCSPYPTLDFESEAINEKDIIVKFYADNVSLCVNGGFQALNRENSHFFTEAELFDRAGIKKVKDSEIYISW